MPVSSAHTVEDNLGARKLNTGEISAPRATIGLLLITAAVLFQVVRCHFVGWDDGRMVVSNPYLHPLNATNLAYFWSHSYYGLNIPVTYTFYGVLYAVCALARHVFVGANGSMIDRLVFHAAGLAIHCCNVLLVFSLARRFTKGSIAAAFVGALLFAIHPLQVESVAWVGTQDTILSSLLVLLSMSAYLSAITQGSEWDGTGKIKPGKYAIATLLFVLALLAKPSAVVCPLLAAIVACGLMRRSARSAAIELCPWAAVSCVWVLVTSGAQPFNHAVGGPIWLRPLIAGDATAFYLFKLIAPSQSAIDYGRTPADVVTHFWGYLTWLLPAVLGYGLWRVRKPAPWALICAAIFVAALLPVLGFVPFAFQVFSTVADRYAYLAMLGPSLALAIGLACLEITPYARLSWAASVAALILMGLVSAKQTTVWHDSITLFSNTVAINPYSPKVHYDLGTWLLYVNDPADAAQQLHDATVLLPRFSEAHKNLAIALGELNHPAEATAEYSLSLSLAPILPSYQSRTGR